MVNRSVSWASWDDELLKLELEELNATDFDLSLTGFDPGEIDALMVAPENDERANAAPPLPENPVSRPGDLWLCGRHRVLCGDATNAEAVARLLSDRKPILMVTDPPYGIELDSEWRDRAGLNGGDFGSKRTRASKARAAADSQYHAEASYMKHRTTGHTETSISGDTRADWSGAFELVPSLQIAYVWHASRFTREVLDGLLRIGFIHHQQIIWDKQRTVLTRTLYWFQHEPCWFVRKKNAVVRESR
jgi:DNA modification methylase